MRWNITLILCSLPALHSAWATDITLSIATHKLRASIANTPTTRKQGLKSNTQLCRDCGMLFIFPRTGKHSFWMKDTPLPLSIAFIAADGSILNIAEMQPNTTLSHTAQGEALYALEMNRGWFTEHAIKANDHVDGLRKTPLAEK